ERLNQIECPSQEGGLYMAQFGIDPVHNVIQLGIKDDIEFAMKHERWRAAITLIFAGIDLMAFLGMPAGKDSQTKSDFITWAEGYISFPCAEHLTGIDLYGCRCGFLHAYSIDSELSRNGKCRRIGFIANDVKPEVKVARTVDPDLVLLTIPG